MAATTEKIDKIDKIDKTSASRTKINPKAPAGSEESLGAESVRDGRPSTDDSVVEAMDEGGPDTVK